MNMNASDAVNVKIILGSTRQGRFSDKPGLWILEKAKERKDIDAELLDLRDYPLPFYNEPISPSVVKNSAYSSEFAREWAEKIKNGDAFIIVTPEYNYGISGVLKNSLDSVYAEWNNKPVAFVAYGAVGGARAVEHLRNAVSNFKWLQSAMPCIFFNLGIFWTKREI